MGGWATHASIIIPNDKHKARPGALVRAALLVQRAQARAVLVQAVDEVPLVLDALAFRDHNPDLLRDRGREQPHPLTRVLPEAFQLEGLEGRRPHWRDGSVYGGRVDAVYAVVVVVVVVVLVMRMGERAAAVGAGVGGLLGDVAWLCGGHV